MCRRLSTFACVAALIAVQFGCRSSCGDRHGWFSARARCEAPCQLVGRNDGCFDGATGQPCPCPPEALGNLIPGGPFPAYPGPAPGVGSPNELHMPLPADRIQPPAVPYPAPGSDASLPFPSSPGVPLKTGLNK